MRAVLRLCVVAVVVASLGSCKAPPTEHVCTDIGCASGLRVQLESTPVGAYKVEVLDAAFSVVYTFNCSGTGCSTTILARDYQGTSANIRVTTTQGTKTTPVSNIVYTVTMPNGDECPPVCKQATVTVPIP